MNAQPRPVPVVDDPDTAGFWAAAARHELVVQRCTSCARVIHLPRPQCSCGSSETAWHPTPGRGSVFSFTVVKHQIHPAFETPYTIALVQLDEHPSVRLVAFLPGEVGIDIGTPMQVVFETYPGAVVPNWVPATEQPST
jgi:uncharacterized protein